MDSRPNAFLSKLLTGVETLLWIIGLCLLGWIGYVELSTRAFELRAEQALRSDRSDQTVQRVRADAITHATPGITQTGAPPPARPAMAAQPVLAEGDPVGTIEIPRIGLSAAVAEGASNAVLRHAVGHLADTPLPGFGGNVAIAGHRDRQFRPLQDIVPGDEIVVTTPTRTLRYRVEWTRIIDPTDLAVLAPTPAPSLTLITCHPFQYIGHAPNRFIVRALRVADTPTPQPAG